MISQLPQISFKVVFLFKTFTGNFNVYHIIGQETPPLLKPSGKMLKETKYGNSCCKSNWNTRGAGGGKGGRERSIVHTCIPTSPCCQLYSCCPAANLGRQLNAFARNYVGTFSETPICSLLRFTQVFSLGFLPFPRRWVRRWIQICAPANPVSGCKTCCQPGSGFQWKRR